jgi:hypothetical protein
MGFSKQILIFFTVCLSSCTFVTTEELNPKGLVPDPLFSSERDLVLLPIEIQKNEKEDPRNIWKRTQLEYKFYGYLQFLNRIPVTLDQVIVVNQKQMEKVYYKSQEDKDSVNTSSVKSVKKGDAKPPLKEPKKESIFERLQKRNKMVLSTIEDNTRYWMKRTPEIKEDLERRYNIPSFQRLKIGRERKPHNENLYKAKQALIAKLVLTKDNRLRFIIYDSLSDTTILEYEKPFLKNTSFIDTKDLQDYVQEYAKKVFALATQNNFAKVTVNRENDPKLEVFIDGSKLSNPSLFLMKGEHHFFATYKAKIIQDGNIDVKQDGKITVNVQKIIKESKEVSIDTKPFHAAIYVDESFMGFSPITVNLEKGAHLVRASLVGYNHINRSINVKEEPLKLLIDFQMQDGLFKKKLSMVHNIKIVSFFSAIMSFAGLAYSLEQQYFYAERVSSVAITGLDRRREKQFEILVGTFSGLGAAFLLTAIVTQVYEYQMQDVGIGLDDDKKLGLQIHF